MRTLFICGALAAGEFAASAVPQCAEAWPVVVVAAVLVALFGYGLAARGWPLAVVFLCGVALFLHASVEGERAYRDRPWMRGRRCRPRQVQLARNGIAASVKRDLSARIALGLDHDGEVVALNRAILLGERARLPRRIRKVFVESGTMHVFAISGLHVMAVAKVLTVMLAFLLVPRRFIGAAAIPLLWGYVHLIGWSPSAVRAAMMMTFCQLAPIFWRRPNGLRAWALTYLLVHVVNPLMIVDIGCALSFAVMLAIILASERGRTTGGWRSVVWIAVVAWAAGLPISAHAFGRITPGAILANVVLIAAVGYTVVAGVVGLSASYVSETVAAHLNNLSALCTRAMVGVSEAVSRLPGANFETERWTILQCAEWYALLLLVVLLARLFRRRRPF